MPRKNISELDSITGNELTEDDLIHPWDAANSINKKMRINNMFFFGRNLRRTPMLSDFDDATWINQDGTILTEVTAGLLFDNHSGTGGENLNSYVIPMPTPPFSVELGIITRNTANHAFLGFSVGHADGTKFAMTGPLSVGYAPYIYFRFMNNHTEYSGTEYLYNPFTYTEHFLKYVDDGDNIYAYISPDLENWVLYFTTAKSGLWGGTWNPTVMGFAGWKLNSIYEQGLLTHWKVTGPDEDISMLLWGDDDDGITFDGSDYIVYE